MPQFGLNLLLWTTAVDDSFAPLCEKVKQWGYDGVEIPLFDIEGVDFDAAGRQLDDLGLGRTTITVCTVEENPASPDAAVRQAAVDRLKRVIDASQAVNSKLLCGPIHSALGHFTGVGPTADEWKWSQETFAQVADHAQKADVTLVLEYLNRFECYFLNCAEDCARFVRELNHPHVRMMYDTFHANIEEKDPVEAIRTCGEFLAHVHISENDRSTPGSGHVPWEATFSTLRSVNYDGWLMIEAFGLYLADLAAATKIWRRMYESEEQLAVDGLKFMKSGWERGK